MNRGLSSEREARLTAVIYRYPGGEHFEVLAAVLPVGDCWRRRTLMFQYELHWGKRVSGLI